MIKTLSQHCVCHMMACTGREFVKMERSTDNCFMRHAVATIAKTSTCIIFTEAKHPYHMLVFTSHLYIILHYIILYSIVQSAFDVLS